MNKRLLAIIFTISTLSGPCLQAQFDKFGFSFEDSEQYNYYPVTVYNFETEQWDDTSQSRVKQCLVGQDLYCPYVSPELSISIKLNPDGSVFTLPNIFEEYYELKPDYTYDDLKTGGLAITYRSDELPEYP